MEKRLSDTLLDSVKDDSIILFDEPENSLSAQWQMELANSRGIVRAFNCQLVIATHLHLYC